MAKRHPKLSDCLPLVEWLNKHNAKCLWQRLPPTDGAATVEAWVVNGHVVLIVIYADRAGWDLYTGMSTNDIAETLADAERRVGLS